MIEQFVVRGHQFDTVLEVIRGNLDASSFQHVMLVAPRGGGKTMLLARVAAELRGNMALSKRLLAVRFMEESHEVFDLADFWLDALFYLAQESTMCDPDLAQELRATHGELTARWRDRIEAHARSAVLSAADRLGRRLASVRGGDCHL